MTTGDSIFDMLGSFKWNTGSMREVPESHGGEVLKPSEELVRKIGSKGFNLEQMNSVLTTRGNQLVVSSAGSGKTTTMVFKILYDIRSGYATRVLDVNDRSVRVPEKIWVCTFLHSGADELRNSMRRWIREFGLQDVSESVQFSTLHAEFLRALKAYGFFKPLVKDSVNSNYLKQVVKSLHLTNSKGNPLNAEDYKNLEGALAYTRNRLDAKRYDKDIYNDFGIGSSIVDAILRDWKQKRAENGVVDFDDLQELMYKECYEYNNEGLIDFLSNRYNFIYIDEFQDTSQVQYEVLKVYAMKVKQVLAIGDDDQTIYSWRGSDHEIITKRFREDFLPVINQLPVNYRCPKNILDSVIPSITKNKNRFDKPLQSYSEGGHVRVLAAKNYGDMVNSLADCIYNDLKKNMSVAILCRVNVDGLLPALMLDKLGKFSFSLSGEGMTLDSYIGNFVRDIVKLFTENATPAIKKALGSLTYNSRGIDQLIEVFKRNRGQNIWNVDSSDLLNSCPDIYDRVMDWRQSRESMGDMRALAKVLSQYRTMVFVRDTQFNKVMRSTILSIEEMLAMSTAENPESFLEDLENINDRLRGRIKASGRVMIATVHEFKGKEADSVYIWNDSADVFPPDREMSAEEYEEERRIHYIACTRARNLSTIMYVRGYEGDFVKEMDLSKAEELNGTAVLSGILASYAKFKKNYETAIKEVGENSEVDGEWVSAGIYTPFENEFWDDGNQFLADDE